MKKRTRIVAMFLCLLLLCSGLAACGAQEKQAQKTDGTDQGTKQTDGKNSV